MDEKNMKTVCKTNMCTGCMACLTKCSRKAIHVCDEVSQYNAYIDETLCIECGACRNVCQVNNPLELKEPILWKEGWASDSDVRDKSSSGGLATALMISFVQEKGTVCSCVFIDGEFHFEFAESVSEVFKFTGSKYVKSNPVGIHKEIINRLKLGQSILFIGLPCQVAGVKATIPKKYQQELYTIDLICHGTPSPQLLSQYLKDKGYDLKTLKDIKFRKKTAFRLYEENYKSIEMEGIRDRYSFSFLRGLNYTENCYSCKYATSDRISDITLGDSWGSELPDNERGAGVSLMLCQNEKGKKLLELADLVLKDVDVDRAISFNRQLHRPSDLPKQREKFFELVERGISYDNILFRCYPKIFFRQNVKKFLMKFHLCVGGG